MGMGWEVELIDDRGHSAGSFKYTHDLNDMIAEALATIGYTDARVLESDDPFIKLTGPAWWKRLDGLPGRDGREFLDRLADELDHNPVKYNAMNAVSGWGTRDSLVSLLRRMIASVPPWPCIWSARG